MTKPPSRPQSPAETPAALVGPFDFRTLVQFEPVIDGPRWTALRGRGRRYQVHGTQIGALAIPKTKAYAIVLRLDDGAIEAFDPDILHLESP